MPRKHISAVIIIAAAMVCAAPFAARALSDYSRSCASNSDCVSCKEEVRCLSCLHECYNTYGIADTIPGQKLTRDEYCKKKQAKWCSAQCWDPDDTKEDDYVSTKPLCVRPF